MHKIIHHSFSAVAPGFEWTSADMNWQAIDLKEIFKIMAVFIHRID